MEAYGILLITIDSLRKDFLVSDDGTIINAKNISKMLRDPSTLYINAFTPASGTPLSIFSLFTGKYPFIVYPNPPKPHHFSTLAQKLKDKGFVTVGVHSNPYLNDFNKGFMYFYDLYTIVKKPKKSSSNGHRSSETLKRIIKAIIKGNYVLSYRKIACLYRTLKICLGIDEPPYARAYMLTEFFIDKFRKILAANSNKPFFAWLHFMDMHHPYIPPRKFVNMTLINEALIGAKTFEINEAHYKMPDITSKDLEKIKELYRGTLKYVDSAIGKIIDFLKDLKLYENTMIIITSDHGEGFLEHGFLGHPISLYEEIVRVPLVVKMPSEKISDTVAISTNGKKINKSMVSLIDIKDTIVKGTLPLPAHKIIFMESWYPGMNKELVACRTKEYKLILDLRNKLFELYNLKKDPLEKNNVYDSEYDVAKELKQKLFKHLKKLEKLRRVREKVISKVKNKI